MASTLLTYRDTIRSISPPWLQRGRAEKILYSIAIHIDGMADALVAAVKTRFPGLVTGQSLALIGRERRISRGRLESDEVYAERLTRWLDDHRRRGGPYALLEQLRAHYAAAPFAIDLLYYPSGLLDAGHARRFQMDVEGTITMDDVEFVPDADAVHWARWWLFYHWPTPVGDDGIWDDPGEWDPDPDGILPPGVWDSDLTLQEVTDLRLVAKEWNAAHPFGTIVLTTPGTELWDYPSGPWDEPGGVWGEDDAGLAQLGIG